MKQERNDIQLNLYVGERLDWEHVFIDYAFDEGDFKGLTGSWYEFFTEDQRYDKIYNDQDEDFYYDIWKGLVQAEKTVEGFYDWMEKTQDEEYGQKKGDPLPKEVDEVKERKGFLVGICVHWWRIFDESYLDKDNYKKTDRRGFKTLLKYFPLYEK